MKANCFNVASVLFCISGDFFVIMGTFQWICCISSDLKYVFFSKILIEIQILVVALHFKHDFRKENVLVLVIN